MPNIYVLSKQNTPLMPIHGYGRVKRMLRDGRAVIVNTKPFTIKLTYDVKNPVVDDCLLGIDPGRTNIGLCAVDSKGCVLYASDVVTRNKMITKLMLERKAHRQASRRGERLRRQRRAVKYGLSANAEYIRKLPQCEEPVRCKVIRNTEAKFCNRRRPEGWLTPTANHLLQTHLNLIRKVSRILPVSGVVLEINRFDFARMENPGIRNWEYQKGKLFGFRDVYEAVSHRQNHHCLFCKCSIDHYHHVIPKHRGGSESVDNYAGLCEKHHGFIHTGLIWQEKLHTKQQGLLKKYHALSVMNQIMPRLLKEISVLYPLYITTGYETKCIRELYGLHKDHAADAWGIAVSVLDREVEMPHFEEVYTIQQFRRHDRAIINNQRERSYYLDDVLVAKNRHRRFEQTSDSLEEFALKHPKDVAGLTVKKSVRHYNIRGRILPGAVFLYNNKRYVLSGQLTGGQYLRAIGDTKTNFPAKKCIIQQSGGLVYI